ncbi:hypothetical protein PBRA_000120 [Plasmodiophora brassicae]|uniref:Uncharacterized protein n=1 Tax=Plasmodiophora brassicae TaxID=37360 RepID=A0A0G4IGV2_PLABS|nr:hypothetical protein PBRA_000120 [Plasmodiophora brassicae]
MAAMPSVAADADLLKLQDMELESSARLTEELASALDVQCQLRVRNQSLLRTIENQAHTIELLLTKQFQAANDIESLKSSAKSAQDDFEERLRIRDKAYAVLERQHADQMSETTYLKAQLEQLSALLASTRREAASQVESALSTPRKEDSQRLHETLAEIEALRLASRLHEEKADEFRSQVCRLDEELIAADHLKASLQAEVQRSAASVASLDESVTSLRRQLEKSESSRQSAEAQNLELMRHLEETSSRLDAINLQVDNMQAENANRVANLTGRLEQLQAVHDDQLKVGNEERSELLRQVARLQADNDTLRLKSESASRLEQQIEDLAHSRLELTKEIDELRSRERAVREERDRSREERDRSIDRVRELQAEYKRIVEERDRSLDRIAELQAGNQRAIEECHESIRERDRSREERERSLERLAEIEVEKNNIVDERDKLIQEHDKSIGRITELQADNVNHVRRLGELDEEISMLKALNSDLLKEVENLKSNNASISSRVHERQLKIDALTADLASALADVDRRTEDLAAARARWEQLETRLNELNSSFTSSLSITSNAKETLLERIAELQADNANQRTRLAELNDEVGILRNTKSDLLKEIEDGKSENASIAARLRERQMKMDALTADLAAALSDLHRRTEELSDMRIRYEHLERQLNEVDSKLTSSLSTASNEKETLLQRIAELEAGNGDLRKRCRELENEVAVLSNMKSGLLKEIEGVKSDNASIATRLHERELRIDALAADLASALSGLDRRTVELSDVNARCKDLDTQLNDLSANFADKLSTASQAKDRLLIEAETLGNEVSRLREYASALDASLGNRVNTLDGCVSAIASSVADLLSLSIAIVSAAESASSVCEDMCDEVEAAATAFLLQAYDSYALVHKVKTSHAAVLAVLDYVSDNEAALRNELRSTKLAAQQTESRLQQQLLDATNRIQSVQAASKEAESLMQMQLAEVTRALNQQVEVSERWETDCDALASELDHYRDLYEKTLHSSSEDLLKEELRSLKALHDAKLLDASRANAALQDKVNEYQEACIANNTRASSLQSQLALANETIEQSKRELEALETAHRSKLADVCRANEVLTLEVKEHAENTSRLAQHNEALQAEQQRAAEASLARITQLSAQVAGLQGTIDQHLAERIRLTQANLTLQEAIEQSKSGREQMASDIAARDGRVSLAEQETHQMRSACDDLRKQCEHLERELSQRGSDIDSLSRNLDESRSTVEQLRQELASKDRENAWMQAEMESWIDSSSARDEDSARLRDQAVSAFTLLNDRMAQLGSLMDYCTDHCESLCSQRSGFKQLVSDLETQIADLCVSNIQQESQYFRLQNANAELRHSLVQRTTIIDTLCSRLDGMHAQLERAQAYVAAVVASCESDKAGQSSTHREHMDSLSCALEDQRAASTQAIESLQAREAVLSIEAASIKQTLLLAACAFDSRCVDLERLLTSKCTRVSTSLDNFLVALSSLQLEWEARNLGRDSTWLQVLPAGDEMHEQARQNGERETELLTQCQQAQSEVMELKKRLSQGDQEQLRLRSHLDALEMRNAELCEKLESAERNLRNAVESIHGAEQANKEREQSLNRQLRTHASRENELQSALHSAESKCEFMEEENRIREAHLVSESEERIAILNAVIERHDADLKAVTSRCEKLQEQIGNAGRLIETLRADIARVTASEARLQSQYDQHQDEHRHQVQRLELSIAALTGADKDSALAAEALMKEHEELRKKYEACEDANKQLRTMLDCSQIAVERLLEYALMFGFLTQLLNLYIPDTKMTCGKCKILCDFAKSCELVAKQTEAIEDLGHQVSQLKQFCLQQECTILSMHQAISLLQAEIWGRSMDVHTLQSHFDMFVCAAAACLSIDMGIHKFHPLPLDIDYGSMGQKPSADHPDELLHPEGSRCFVDARDIPEDQVAKAYYAPRYLGDSRDEHDSFQGEMNNPRETLLYSSPYWGDSASLQADSRDETSLSDPYSLPPPSMPSSSGYMPSYDDDVDRPIENRILNLLHVIDAGSTPPGCFNKELHLLWIIFQRMQSLISTTPSHRSSSITFHEHDHQARLHKALSSIERRCVQCGNAAPVLLSCCEQCLSMPSALVDTSRDSDSGSPRDRDAAEAMRMGLSLAASIIPDLETQNRNLNLDAARSVRGKQAYKTMLEEADAELKATAAREQESTNQLRHVEEELRRCETLRLAEKRARQILDRRLRVTQDSLALAREEQKQLIADRTRLESLNRKYAAELSTSVSTVDELREQIAGLNMSVGAFTAKLQESESRLSRTRTTEQDHSDRVATLEQTLQRVWRLVKRELGALRNALADDLAAELTTSFSRGCEAFTSNMNVIVNQVARREGQADTISKEMADLKQRHLVQYQALQKAGPQLKECKIVLRAQATKIQSLNHQLRQSELNASNLTELIRQKNIAIHDIANERDALVKRFEMSIIPTKEDAR